MQTLVATITASVGPKVPPARRLAAASYREACDGGWLDAAGSPTREPASASCCSTMARSFRISAVLRKWQGISCRLFQNFPVTPSISGLVAAQMAVSAPARGPCAVKPVRVIRILSGRWCFWSAA